MAVPKKKVSKSKKILRTPRSMYIYCLNHMENVSKRFFCRKCSKKS